MDDRIKEWKKTLDVTVDYFLASDASPSVGEFVQESYDDMFKDMINKDKLLDAYRQDNNTQKQLILDLSHKINSLQAFLSNEMQNQTEYLS